MNDLYKLFGVVSKGLSIIMMVVTFTVVAITVKSCSQSLEVIEARK